jgi:hypothetical protein
MDQADHGLVTVLSCVPLVRGSQTGGSIGAAPILFADQQSAGWLPNLTAFMNYNNIHCSVIDQKTPFPLSGLIAGIGRGMMSTM